MAVRWQSRYATVAILALLLILPPVTGAAADWFGVDLSHHHCTGHAPDEHDWGDTVSPDDLHAAKSEPFQCDQCHVALAALIVISEVPAPERLVLPRALSVAALHAVRAPPPFKPPIA